MGCEGIFQQCKDLGLRTSTALVFLFLRDETACEEDLCMVISREQLADRLELTEKQIRGHLTALKKVGLITVLVKSGRGQAMRISVSSRSLEGQQKGQQKGQLKSSKIELNVVSEGQQKGQQKGQSVVVGSLDVDSAVITAVDSSGLESVLLKGLPAQNGAPEPTIKPKKKRRGDPPHFRALTDHITTTYGKLKGVKYPFQVWELNRLRELGWFYDAAMVMAWWDCVFTNDWCKTHGLSLRSFFSDLPKLQDDPYAKKRADDYRRKLDTEGEPPTARELKQQLEQPRRTMDDLVSGLISEPRRIAGFVAPKVAAVKPGNITDPAAPF